LTGFAVSSAAEQSSSDMPSAQAQAMTLSAL
jgi:hypothetical protein